MKKVVCLLSVLGLVTLLSSQCNFLQRDPFVDLSFDTIGPDNRVWTMDLQEDGKIVIGGFFMSVGNTPQHFIARLNSDGTPDLSFHTGDGGGTIHSVVVQPDGKILVGGYFSRFDNQLLSRIIRLNHDGSIDKQFKADTSIDAAVLSIGLQTDGKILIGGMFTEVLGVKRNRIARLNNDGTLDLSFDPGIGADEMITDILVQPDGKILLTGWFKNFNNTSYPGIVRLNINGSIDPAMSVKQERNANTAALDKQGRILLAEDRFFIRLYSDGTYDPSFQVKDMMSVYAIKVLDNGQILIGGDLMENKLLLLNEDGSVARKFHADSLYDNEPIRCLQIQKDGSILAGGSFRKYNWLPYDYLVRLRP